VAATMAVIIVAMPPFGSVTQMPKLCLLIETAYPVGPALAEVNTHTSDHRNPPLFVFRLVGDLAEPFVHCCLLDAALPP